MLRARGLVPRLRPRLHDARGTSPALPLARPAGLWPGPNPRADCGRCAHPSQPYWKSISDFAQASGHKLMFGLIPNTTEASALITHSAKTNIPIHAYTFGNEQDSPVVSAGYPVIRKLLDDAELFPAGSAPKLAGPDVALCVAQPSRLSALRGLCS